MVTAGDRFGEHYEILAAVEMSSIAFTDLFRATDTRSDVEVIIEILKPSASSVEKARFGTRARRLLSAKQPSLVELIDVQPMYCVLEAPFGEPLSDHAGIAIARSRQKLAWLSQIASGLAELHKAAIVHGKLDLQSITVRPDGVVKLSVPVGGDVGASSLDDVRAFGRAACELILGHEDRMTIEMNREDEAAVSDRLHNAGIGLEAARVLGRACVGSAMTSADLADKLAPYSEYAGPSTEPLLQVRAPIGEGGASVVPGRNPRRTDPMGN
ncbi:MAG: protein kinase [Deltaproteobacteria bacterium]|nr:protein kinase [Deltaproteobacteria bacterium]